MSVVLPHSERTLGVQGGAGGRRGKEIPGDTHSGTLTSASPPPGVPTPYKSQRVYLKIQECNRVRKVGRSSADSTMTELNHTRSRSKPGGDPQKSQLPWIPSQPQVCYLHLVPKPTPPPPPRSMEIPDSGHSCWECPLHLQESTPIFRGSSPGRK